MGVVNKIMEVKIPSIVPQSSTLWYERVCSPFLTDGLERGGRMRSLCVFRREHPSQEEGEGRTAGQLC